MQNTNMPSGIIAAIPTPFSPDGSVNIDAFVKFATFLLENGCSGLNILGTTGEATSLSLDERLAFMTEVSLSGLPMSRLIVGTGASAATEAKKLTQHAGKLGFSGALLLPPFYYKNISNEGMLQYVSEVIDGTLDNPIPISLYNFPAMSGVTYNIELLSALRDRHGYQIAGLKDSSNDLAYCSQAKSALRNFKIYPSNEASLLTGKSSGFAGCISATINLSSGICASALESNDESLLEPAVEIREALSGLPLVAAVKLCIALLTFDENWTRLRPPLTVLDDEQEKLLLARLEKTKFKMRPLSTLSKTPSPIQNDI